MTPANPIISEFLGLCKQKKYEICTSETVRGEATTRFYPIVNRYFDRVGIRAFPVRKYIYSKFRARLLDLLNKSCDVKTVNADATKARTMYQDFSKDPELFKRLRALQVKYNRDSIFPSDNDVQILADADKLGQKYDVRFITDDHHFLDFKDEIEERLNVKLVGLLDLVHYQI